MRRWTQRRSKSLRSKYRSKFEERLAGGLAKRGIAFSYETSRFDYTVLRRYTPDFVFDNGVIIEAKGYFTSEDRTKHLRVRECNPELDIRFCFQNASNKLNKKSKTSYADWCDKHGFLWCERVIPTEWVS
jgi:hypothetical protein